MRRARRVNEEINISFLDVICCGFGAIVLLLLLTKPVEPVPVEDSETNLDGLLVELRERLFALRGETKVLNLDLKQKREQIAEEKRRIAALKGELSGLQERLARASDQVSVDAVIAGELATARQKLTEEMRRLSKPQTKNSVIGGIPVDSEYIIFIIDTSGSMFNYSWGRMIREFNAVLEIYPRVKGLQVMNDMGEYMFSSYRRKWIP
ncbi:MAG: VWA domain-containing protein, partial [Gammaproteobacteria bacterium]|nr:VWA domain-containing protein [Gammaproteobacteria bacterium]